ncbi:hypothetical protein [uncultured Chryseobacterium sp.]|uniref:hypothetical protein n=1 Tax=uncultured Chryseobacterium sp. TaxID=259322 RepID=UPI0025D399D3|nr:hypothetical protein [uncultured Chryseobacterium sp.]
MRKLLKTIIVALIPLLTTAACKHQSKEEEVNIEKATDVKKNADHITKEVYTDDFGDQLEVAVNETQNTVTVRLDGKTYELKKNEEMPEFTAADAFYQFSDVRGEVTFLKKDYNMVLFHHKKSGTSSSDTKMASY